MSEATFCYKHPNIETVLRCSKCERPICPKCMVETPIGFRCRECGTQRMAVYELSPLQWVIGIVVGLGGGILGGYIGNQFGFFVLFFAPIIGGFIGEGVSRAIQRRRSKWIAVLTGLGIAIGAAVIPIFNLLPLLQAMPPSEEKTQFILSHLINPWALLFMALAIPSAYWRLR